MYSGFIVGHRLLDDARTFFVRETSNTNHRHVNVRAVNIKHDRLSTLVINCVSKYHNYSFMTNVDCPIRWKNLRQKC